MIDTHHHLWKYRADEYPWIPPGSPLTRDYLVADLEAATAAAGVDGTVVVQARQTPGESAWLLELAETTRVIRGIVGWVPLIDPEVGDLLSRLAAYPKFKGVRHVLQDEPDSYFLRDDFHRGLGLLPDLDLRYDLLLFQRQLPLAIQLADRHPDLAIIIDHIAKPVIRKGLIDPAWKTGMTELAKRDNVLGVKISGMVTEVTDPQLDEATLHAYFDATLEIFGADRLMIGTDWPVCLLRVATYQEWTGMARGFVARLSPDEAEAILDVNATIIYDL